MPRWLKYVLLILTLLLIGGIPLAMQLENGSIQGVITENRAAVAKASVEARNVMTGEVTRAESDAEGHYTLGGLRAGRYSLWVQAERHRSVWIREVVVERGQVTHKDVDLARITTLTSGL
jgi:iron complex outermembrane receptor protein